MRYASNFWAGGQLQWFCKKSSLQLMVLTVMTVVTNVAGVDVLKCVVEKGAFKRRPNMSAAIVVPSNGKPKNAPIELVQCLLCNKFFPEFSRRNSRKRLFTPNPDKYSAGCIIKIDLPHSELGVVSAIYCFIIYGEE